MIDTTIITPGKKWLLEEMADKWERMTPEERAASDRVTTERRKQEEQRGRQVHVEQLRTDWDAPLRHLSLKSPKRDGEWGRKLEALQCRMGKGVTVALVGVRGNGKTQMAVQLMLNATEALRSAKYCTAAKFFMAIKASYKKESEATEASVLKSFRKPVLLVVDEVGKRSDSEWQNGLLFELLNDRYNDMTDTVLIDNRKKAEFVAAIGPSLASRMSEAGGIIECDWESFR